jgi:hypothetical protein
MSSRLAILQAFTRQLHLLLPGVRCTRTAVLALLVVGLLYSGTIALPRIAAAVPVPASHASTERRLRRWLANAAVDPHALSRAVLAEWANRDLLLVFDPSPLTNRATMLVLGVVVRHRVLPLVSRTVPQQAGRWATSQNDLMIRLMDEVAAALPPGVTVTLVADRQMSGVALLDACRTLGWHVVVRLNGGAKKTVYWRAAPDAVPQSVATLVTGPGQRWQCEGLIFPGRKARPGWLTIWWQVGADAPWLLISDRPGGGDRIREYRRRARCEATYEDLKQRGFNLERSKLRDLVRVERLLLAVHLAYWWGTRLGLRVIRQGQRRRYDRPGRRRDLSIVRLGWTRFREVGLCVRRVPLLFLQRTGCWCIPGMNS